MDPAKKEDCKYWDKCYQRNENHIQKYNHPPSTAEKNDDSASSAHSSDTETSPEDQKTQDESNNRKRRSSESADNNENQPKRNTLTTRLWQNPDEDYNELLKSNRFIHVKFLVKMPPDFYKFWDFVSTMATADVKNPFHKMGLELVGPFDYMAGRFAGKVQKSPGDYLRHWRFYYDPPEFQTIFVKRGTGVHYGYWRDDPKDEENLLIARNDVDKGCHFEFIATNAFDALAYFLEKDFAPNPFTQGELTRIRKAINEYVTVHKIERPALAEAKIARWKKVVAKSFHGAGIVVPVDKKSTVGYRPLIDSDANLKKIINQFEKGPTSAEVEKIVGKLQPFITASVIALDESDFGTNLELGIDMFESGYEQLNSIIESLLVPAYTFLERPQFLAILKAHINDRRKGHHLSIID